MGQCKHKFKARYDEKYSTVAERLLKHGTRLKGNGCDLTEPYMTERTYVHDICVKCGEVRKRGE